MTNLRERCLAPLGPLAGMLAFPAAYWLLQAYGPSSRVSYYTYLPGAGVRDTILAALVGLWLGAGAYRLFDRRAGYSTTRLTIGCLLGVGAGFIAAAVLVLVSLPVRWLAQFVPLVSVIVAPVVGAWGGGFMFCKSADAPAARRFAWIRVAVFALLATWFLIPEFKAFPKGGTVAEREAWTRRNVPQYASLARIVQAVPAVAADVGRVVAMAPTAGDKHAAAQEMDGQDMNFTLEVVGEKGTGVFHVECMIDHDAVLGWRTGRWTFNGKTSEITAVPNLYRPKS